MFYTWVSKPSTGINSSVWIRFGFSECENVSCFISTVSFIFFAISWALFFSRSAMRRSNVWNEPSALSALAFVHRSAAAPPRKSVSGCCSPLCVEWMCVKISANGQMCVKISTDWWLNDWRCIWRYWWMNNLYNVI